MSSTQASSEQATQKPSAARVDLKLEVVVIPVSDVDRAKRFYGSLGWRLDADFTNGVDWRVVQLTPPGSPCSIHFGMGLTTAVPGSVKNLYLAGRMQLGSPTWARTNELRTNSPSENDVFSNLWSYADR